jgi:SAM-dependent methyltransferase
MITKLAKAFSQKSRAKRSAMFLQYLQPTEQDKILDLGSEDGTFIAGIIPFRKNVFIADINEGMLIRGKRQYGFNIVLLGEDGLLPFEDGYFDIVHCNSVIEHVTVDKTKQWSVRSQKEFTEVAFKRQKQFANEIRRVAKSYFVQTPNKDFIFESHTWLPLVQFLPRPVLVKMINWLNKWWVKKTTPDWNLLTERQMKELFPDAIIIREKTAGFTKSFIAIRGNNVKTGN